MSGWRFGLALLCALALPAEAQARRVGLAFDMYAGGLHALAADIVMELADDRYRARSTIATRGFLDFLTRWHARQESIGSLAGGGVHPSLHTRDSEWRFERRFTRMQYDASGDVSVTVEPPPEQDERPPVPPELRRGTVDLLSVLVKAALAADPAAACRDGAAIYDGRRRYDVVFAAAGEEVLPPQAYGSYAGPALLCRVSVTPVAGFRGESEEESGLGMPAGVSIWLAAHDAAGLVVPVRFEAEFGIGFVIGHLTGVEAPAE